MNHPHSDQSWENCQALLEEYLNLSQNSRVQAVIELIRSPYPDIREKVLHMGAVILSEDTLVRNLKNTLDDSVRNASFEMLKIKGGDVVPLLMDLLNESDSELVLQCLLILDYIGDPRAIEGFEKCLEHDDLNVVQAAITALGHSQAEGAVDRMKTFLNADPWLQPAAVQALADLKSVRAVPWLSKQLTDPFIGFHACEALTDIGNREACSSLIGYLENLPGQPEREALVTNFWRITSQARQLYPELNDLEDLVLKALDNDDPTVSHAAAQLVLILELQEADVKALEILLNQSSDTSQLPFCLEKRTDLVFNLLSGDEIMQVWGLKILAKNNWESVPDFFPAYLLRMDNWNLLNVLADVLLKLPFEPFAENFVRFYSGVPVNLKGTLNNVIIERGQVLRHILDREEIYDRESAVIISCLTRTAGEPLPGYLPELSVDCLHLVLPFLVSQGENLYDLLPWKQLFGDDPEHCISLAVDVTCRSKDMSLVPDLKMLLSQSGHPDIIRLTGEIRDRGSVNDLVMLYEKSSDYSKVLIIDALGRIGGNEACQFLREILSDPDPNRSRLVYRALSQCGTADDAILFRNAVNHRDWLVRLSCSEFFGRYPEAENLVALSMLLSDPREIVAHRASDYFSRIRGAG